MIQKVVPTIFAKDISTLKHKFELLKFSSKIHLDICDSKFVPTKTISLRDCFTLRDSSQEIEVHLMVQKPLDFLSDCHTLHVKRVFIHREIFDSIEDFLEVKKQFSNVHIEVALVCNPETKVEDSLIFLSEVNHVLLMSVVPGAEGQSFIFDVLNKIRQIKVLLPEMKIQIDGGITLETGEISLKKGIDTLSVGSFISSSKTPKKNYNLLLKL